MVAINNNRIQVNNLQQSREGKKNESSLTSEATQSSIESNFDTFISKFVTTQVQNNTAFDIASVLIQMDPKINIQFERAVEDDEIVFVAQNSNAQNIIVLDSEGDIMISHSPYVGDGWREFINHGDVDAETVVFKFLTL